MTETVTITKKEYEDLLDSQKMLIALESAVVDNWEGYDFALEIYRGEALIPPQGAKTKKTKQ